MDEDRVPRLRLKGCSVNIGRRGADVCRRLRGARTAHGVNGGLLLPPRCPQLRYLQTWLSAKASPVAVVEIDLYQCRRCVGPSLLFRRSSTRCWFP